MKTMDGSLENVLWIKLLPELYIIIHRITSETIPQVVIFHKIIIANKLITQKRPDYPNGSFDIDFHSGAIPNVPNK